MANSLTSVHQCLASWCRVEWHAASCRVVRAERKGRCVYVRKKYERERERGGREGREREKEGRIERGGGDKEREG